MDASTPPNGPGASGRPRLTPRAFEIAARIRSRRQQLGLTSVEVANKIGVPSPRYRSWEKQLGPATENQYLDALARVLTVAPDWLSHGTGVAPIPPEENELPLAADIEHLLLTTEERKILAKRAYDRRLSLRLDRQEVALRIGIPTHGLKNWEFKLPQKRQNNFEIAWEAVLGVPEGWLRMPEMAAPPPTKDVLTQTISVKADSVAGEIRMAASWLCRSSFAKRTTDFHELFPSEQRLADIFALRYGVDGEANTKLRVIGERYGLTRERIRQIVEKMADRANRLELKTPFIDRLALEIKAHLPATVESLDRTFRDLLGESLSIESVSRFCREILGRNIVAMTDRPADMTHSWSPTVIDPENHNADRIRIIRDTSMRMIRSCGAAHLFFVAGAAGEVLGSGVLPSDVERDCRMIPGFEWLCEKDGWFWYGEAKENRLISVAIKILASAGQRVDAEEILAGFVRSRRGYYEPDKARPYFIEPPLQVVVEVLCRTKGVKKIQYDDFYLEPAIPVENVLSDAETAVYRLMSDNGNIASRHTLNAQLVETGQVKFMALQVSLNNSPIYRHIDRGVFALRGAPLSASFLKDAQESVGGEAGKGIPLSDRDPNGYFHLDCELSEYMVKTRFWTIPSKMARLLTEGEYSLDGFDEPVVFSRTSNGHYRLRRFLSKALSLGLKAGDRFDFAFNPDTRRMRVSNVDARPEFSLEAPPSGA